MPSTVPEKQPRGEYARSADTRARILDAALAEAASTGFQNTSVASIAARAGVAVGVLNYHFGSKAELLKGLMASQVEAFISRLSPPAGTDGFFEYESRLLATYIEFLHANPAYVRLTEEVRIHDPILYRNGTLSSVDHIAQRIRRGIKRQEVRAMDEPEVRAQAWFMLGTYTFVDRYLEDPHGPDDELLINTLITNLRATFAP